MILRIMSILSHKDADSHPTETKSSTKFLGEPQTLDEFPYLRLCISRCEIIKIKEILRDLLAYSYMSVVALDTRNKSRNVSYSISHPTKNSNPSCTAIIYTSPPLTVCLSGPTSHGPTSYWLPLPTSPSNPTYPTGIYTLYIMSLAFFIHLPMKMEPIRSSETSAIKTQTPGNYPKGTHYNIILR